MLCLKILKESGKYFGYVDFDDEELIDLTKKDLKTVLEAAYMVYGDFDYLFLDEVQNVTGWHLWVNKLLRQRIHIILTGSNAKLLSSDLATHLTGRYNEIPLFPFSFEEYCHMKGLDIKDLTTRNQAFIKTAFDEYMRKGGFPETFKLKNQRKYMTSLLTAIIRKDIAKRFHVRYVDALEKMANYMIDNFCHGVLELIQVTLKMDKRTTRTRELSGLKKGAELLKCENLTLISLSERGVEEYEGHRINKFMVVDWLLGNQ